MDNIISAAFGLIVILIVLIILGDSFEWVSVLVSPQFGWNAAERTEKPGVAGSVKEDDPTGGAAGTHRLHRERIPMQQRTGRIFLA